MTEQEVQLELDSLAQQYALRKEEQDALTSCFKGQVPNAQVRESKRKRIVKAVQAMIVQRQRCNLSPVRASLAEDALELLYRMYPSFSKPVVPEQPTKPVKAVNPEHKKRRRSKIEHVWHSCFPALGIPPAFYFADWKARWSERKIFSAMAAAARSLAQKGEPLTAENAAKYVWGVLKTRDKEKSERKPETGTGQDPRTDTQDVIVI